MPWSLSKVIHQRCHVVAADSAVGRDAGTRKNALLFHCIHKGEVPRHVRADNLVRIELPDNHSSELGHRKSGGRGELVITDTGHNFLVGHLRDKGRCPVVRRYICELHRGSKCGSGYHSRCQSNAHSTGCNSTFLHFNRLLSSNLLEVRFRKTSLVYIVYTHVYTLLG